MKYLIPALIVLLLSNCSSPKGEVSIPAVDSLQLTTYLSELASDRFLGRKPFTQGEEITVNYLKDELVKAGVEPGNGSSYFQEVKMVRIASDRDTEMKVKTSSGEMSLTFLEDFAARTSRVEETTSIENSELVFAGYGIVAPEYHWNDYQGLDMKGKTAVVIVNDPGFHTQDDSVFKGNAMTYYGRWTYKYEEAARQGADGVLIIHETDAAGYPWSVVRGGWGDDQMVLDLEHKNLGDCKLQGWISKEKASELFERSGHDLETSLEQAYSPNFRPFSLNARYSFQMRNSLEYNSSRNVIGKVTGTTHPEETIIYTAHWDHFGIGEAVDGDSIYNGAVDNASGTAAIMEIGRLFSNLDQQPERSVIILAVTAEEQGLLGSQYYAENPIYPVDKTVANINIDAIYAYGRTHDIEIIGFGQSEMDDYARAVCDQLGVEIVPDTNTEKGFFFRSDHIHFAKLGIPCFYGKSGKNSVEFGPEWGQEQQELYRQVSYHAPLDNFDQELFNMGGVVQMCQLSFEIGYNLANTRSFPGWKDGADFSR